jgi:hypothetical protein
MATLPAYGPAVWTDWSDNWRKLDGDFLQTRSILRYATDAGKPSSGEVGQVIYTVDNARLNMWTTKWIQVLSSENLNLVTSGTQARLTHPSAGGAGLLFSSGPNLITSEVDFRGSRIEADTLVIYTTAGGANRTARLTTTPTDLVADSPILASQLTLNGPTTAAVPYVLNVLTGTARVGGAATFGNTITAAGTVQGTRFISTAEQDSTANAATRKDYVDGAIATSAGTRVSLSGNSTVTGIITAQNFVMSGGQGSAVGSVVRRDWADNAFLSRISNTVMNGKLTFDNNGNSEQIALSKHVATDYAHMSFYNSGMSRRGWVGVDPNDDIQLNADTNSLYLGANNRLYLGATSWINFNTSTGIYFSINGAEYMRFGGPGNGAQFMVGKTTSGSSYKGCEISPNGPINVTTFDAGISSLYLRQMNSANANASYFIQFLEHNASEMGRITRRVSPDGIHINNMTYTAASDYRMKDDLGPVDDPLERVMQLRPRHLRWKQGGSEFDGFLAHEVQDVIPNAVRGTKDEVYTDEAEAKMVGVQVGAPKMQQLEMDPIVPLLTAALQELTERVTALEEAA